MGETTTAPEPSSHALGEAIEIGGQGVNVHDGANSPDSGEVREPSPSSSDPLGSASSKIMRGSDEQKENVIYPQLDWDSKVTGDMVYDVAGDAKKVFSTSNVEKNDPSSPSEKLVSPVELKIKGQRVEDDWDNTTGSFGFGLWASFLARHYYVALFTVLTICGSMSIFVMYGPPDQRCTPGATSGQMTVCEPTPYDWSLPFGNASLFKDAYSGAQDAVEAYQNDLVGIRAQDSVAERTKTHSSFNILFIHQNKDRADRSIFTPKKVQEMCNIEKVVTEHVLWKYFCPLDSATGACESQPYSAVNRFYFTEAERKECALLDQSVVDQRATALMTGLLTSANGFFANEGAQEGQYTNATRSMLLIGQPMKGFNNEADSKDEQRLVYRYLAEGITCPFKPPIDGKFTGFTNADVCGGKADGAKVLGVEKAIFSYFKMQGIPADGQFEGALRSPYFADPVRQLDGESDLRSRFYSGLFQQLEFDRIVNGDLNFAILSIICVFGYIWFHTKSSMMASMSMLQIVLSLPVGYFFYFNIFQYRYYSQMHILTIYLALGIGADSIFVCTDAWKESGKINSIRTVAGRCHFALSRTAKSCFNTTFTTVMSFVATSLTPVMPIHCFAVFAALVMAINYLLVITLTPCVIIVYHLHFADKGGFCCYCADGSTNCRWERDEANDTKELRNVDRVYNACCYKRNPDAVSAVSVEDPIVMRATSSFERETIEDMVKRLGAVERFLYKYYSTMLCGKCEGPGWIPGKGRPFYMKPFAMFFICGFLSYAGFMCSRAMQLTPPKTEELWFPETHMHNSDFFSRMANGWKGTSDNEYMQMSVVLGIQKITRPSYNWFFPGQERGGPIFDGDFNLNSAETQLFAIKLCDSLEERVCQGAPCRGGKLMRAGKTATCPVKEVLAYHKAFEGGAATATTVPNFYATYKRMLVDDTPFTTSLCAPRNITGTPVCAGMVAQAKKFNQNRLAEVVGIDGAKVLWTAVRAMTSVDGSSLSNQKGHVLYDNMAQMVDRLRGGAPKGCHSVFFTDLLREGGGFTWMAVEDALVSNLFTGFTICFPVVFAVLVLATGNFFLAFYATLSIGMIVVDVLGAVQVFHKWDLGIAESISGVIVIGFSVDYTVHLGHMYKEAWDQPTREEKTRYALTHMGATVIGGGLTTALAGAVLFLCTLQFFTKMATLLVWTIVLSLLHSMFFFISCCACFGPTGNWGSASYLIDWVRGMFKKVAK